MHSIHSKTPEASIMPRSIGSNRLRTKLSGFRSNTGNNVSENIGTGNITPVATLSLQERFRDSRANSLVSPAKR